MNVQQNEVVSSIKAFIAVASTDTLLHLYKPGVPSEPEAGVLTPRKTTA